MHFKGIQYLFNHKQNFNFDLKKNCKNLITISTKVGIHQINLITTQ